MVAKRIHLDPPMLAAIGTWGDDEGMIDSSALEHAIVFDVLGGRREPADVTVQLLVALVLNVQESLWDGKPVMVRSRADTLTQKMPLPDLGEVATVALDLGLGQHTVPSGASLVEALRALQGPIRKRLADVAQRLLHTAAKAGEIEVVPDRPKAGPTTTGRRSTPPPSSPSDGPPPGVLT